MVIPRFVSAALNGEPMPVYGDGLQSRSFLHVHDAIDGILDLADNPSAVGQVFNIGGSEEITILGLAERVLTRVTPLADATGGINFIPYDEAYAVGYEDVRRRFADTTKIRELTGWQPRRSLNDVIDDVASEMASGLRAEVRGEAIAS